MIVAIYGKNIEEEFLPALKCLVNSLQARRVCVACEEGFAHLLEDRFRYVPGFCCTFGKNTFPASEVAMLLSIGGMGLFWILWFMSRTGGYLCWE